MIVMIQALHKVSKTNFSKALGCSFKKVTRLLVPLYTYRIMSLLNWLRQIQQPCARSNAIHFPDQCKFSWGHVPRALCVCAHVDILGLCNQQLQTQKLVYGINSYFHGNHHLNGCYITARKVIAFQITRTETCNGVAQADWEQFKAVRTRKKQRVAR